MASEQASLSVPTCATYNDPDRMDPSSDYPMPETVPTKSYDWTYTTTYPGHQIIDPPSPSGSVLSTDEDYEPPPPPVTPEIINWNPGNPANPAHLIPIAELTRPDPILFYAEVPLFEDELHDNGSSTLLVRIVGFQFRCWYWPLTTDGRYFLACHADLLLYPI